MPKVDLLTFIRKGGRKMNTTSTAYFRKSDKLFISTASVYIPKTEVAGSSIKWFDDSKLIRKNK